MCGIVGIVRRRLGVARDLIKSLKKLEYRGYDSAGIAVMSNGDIEVVKGVGTIDAVVGDAEIRDGYVGIGHTRWATHGGVSPENAHPHLSCDGEVAVVHNGTLDDFEGMRRELIAEGHVLHSETDTEVVAHLVEENLKSGDGPLSAFVKAVKKLKGSYALVSIISGERALFLARNKSPLVIGLGEDGNYCASDVAALLHLTNRFIFMEDGEIALLTPSEVEIWRLKGDNLEKVYREAEEVEWTPQLLDKGAFDYFMLKEIHEQPHILRKIAESIDYYTRFSERLSSLLRDGSLTIVAAGTSYHAGLIGKYLLSKLAGVRSEIIVASEFPEWSSHLRQGDVVLAISQSGETADVLEAVRIAKSKGSMVVSIVNVPGSTLTRISDESVFIQAGPEVGVAATKTFSAQVSVLYVVSSLISGRSGISRELTEVSELLKGSMDSLEEFSKKMSNILKDKEHVFFLGRGINYPTALEGALKLKEISYIHAEGYPAGEYKHGPLALIEEGTPAIVLVPVNEELRKKTIYNIMEVRSRGAFTITVQPRGIEIPADASLETDVWDELISPLIYTVPLQLIAYHTAVTLGKNPDKPRNLAKSVTVE
ncbi:MAG: glutamine--fructose-6-phosphate transaminase (isomerizing) [Candidatus Korarchaeota archaeon]|nr:glutamine--fructose-6-phosphate transaminase (isomerizing) [Candidatus Korarchaeota archaeon]